MAELAFEYLLVGLEAVAGTPTDPPTHYLNLQGRITPKQELYRPVESRGRLAEFHRSKVVRRWSEFEAEGGLDVYTLPVILNTIAKGSISTPVHPAGGVVGILDVQANVANGEKVVIGADNYEVDIVNTDSTDDTAGGSWANTTDPLVIDLAGIAPGVRGVIAEGDLIRVENEIMKCIDITTTVHTFDRARCGTSAASHADGQNIYISDAPGAPGTDFLVGLVTTLTPVAFANALTPEITLEGTEDITAVARVLGTGTRMIEVTAGAQQALITLSETLAGAGNAWRASVRPHLWEHLPSMTADDLQAMTAYWGDPNVQAFQAAYCQPDEMTISADAAGTDGVTLGLSGQGYFPSKTAPASLPSELNGPLLLPGDMQLWIDTATIGSTAVTGRLVSAELTVPTNLARKWLAQGPGTDLDFADVGRGKRHVELKLVLEVPDMTQYDQWVAQTSLKARIRFNGPSIVSVGSPAVAQYQYAEFDIYGPLDALDWGENEGTNRTVELTILSEYDTTALRDWAARVVNDRATL